MFVVFILSFTRTIVTENGVCPLNHDKELPRQIRRNMKGSESEEIFKEKSSNKRPDRKYHRASKSEKKSKENQENGLLQRHVQLCLFFNRTNAK